jgi:CheY-like chemotaxis protein
LRVLLAEDHLINQKVAQLMLAKLGHEVDTVGNGLEAVEAARRRTYDVVLMDVQMPELDGLGATARIRAELPPECQPRIVALSAGLQDEERSACVEAGMDDFLAKPMRLQQLDALLSRDGGRPSRAPDARITAIRERLDELGGIDRDEDRELFAQLLRSLAGRAHQALDEADDAARRSDGAAFAEHVHGLKGSAANLGGNRLAGLLRGIEEASPLGQPADQAGLGPVRDELTLFCASLLAVADELDERSEGVQAVS